MSPILAGGTVHTLFLRRRAAADPALSAISHIGAEVETLGADGSRCLRCGAQRRRGVVVLPGLGNADGDYGDLVRQLRNRDMVVSVARVARYDWLRNAAVRAP